MRKWLDVLNWLKETKAVIVASVLWQSQIRTKTSNLFHDKWLIRYTNPCSQVNLSLAVSCFGVSFEYFVLLNAQRLSEIKVNFLVGWMKYDTVQEEVSCMILVFFFICNF